MAVALIKWCLKRLLPGVLVCAVLGGGAWWLHHQGWQAGFAAAKSAGDMALASEKTAHADERQKASEATTAALLAAKRVEAAQRSRADGLAAQLNDKNHELERAQALLRLGISKAISDDNSANGSCGFNGLGPHGLQLYARALGYTGGGDARTGDK
ncbi:hypothetical protein NG99_04675 [Erwinia typographi]|uniref:Uncharacterized protein n=2 Tax=Erwinia typographi TaxID=371042 RepID=A0A0A3ZCD4_9GAMM|nr:hypothetical protein NG99_04675 [Erwinia typographi]